VPPPPLLRQRSRVALFCVWVAALLWFLCARLLAESAATGIASRFELSDEEPLMASVFLLFLLVCGLAVLRALERRRAPLRLTLGLPRRRTAREEWAIGGAVGWGLAVVPVALLALMRGLNVELWTQPRAYELMGLNLATLFVATLVGSVALFGYGFQRLVEATGPIRATLVLMLLTGGAAATMTTPLGTPDGVRILIEMLATLLLALCWFRTHGLWLGWGLHFAWAASTGVLFGLPLRGKLDFASIVDTRVSGPLWLTGGSFGPGAALFSIVLLLTAIPILVRLTRDYAWNYTHPPLIPAGYDVTIPPPAAHVAMEQSALAAQPVNPASLVQILPATPQNPVAGHQPE
jgi:uncharacterized protein